MFLMRWQLRDLLRDSSTPESLNLSDCFGSGPGEPPVSEPANFPRGIMREETSEHSAWSGSLNESLAAFNFWRFFRCCFAFLKVGDLFIFRFEVGE
jgi:hypothetical protein